MVSMNQVTDKRRPRHREVYQHQTSYMQNFYKANWLFTKIDWNDQLKLKKSFTYQQAWNSSTCIAIKRIITMLNPSLSLSPSVCRHFGYMVHCKHFMQHIPVIISMLWWKPQPLEFSSPWDFLWAHQENLSQPPCNVPKSHISVSVSLWWGFQTTP